MTYVVSNTQAEGKLWATHYLPQEEGYKVISTENQVRGMAFRNGDCLYICTYNVDLMRVLMPALVGCVIFSADEWITGEWKKKTYCHKNTKTFGPLDEADKCTCGREYCVCWHDEK